MSSRLLATRAKFLLFLSLLSTYAGVAFWSKGQHGPAGAQPQVASGEAAPISAIASPDPATIAASTSTSSMPAVPAVDPATPPPAPPPDPPAPAPAPPATAPAPPPPAPAPVAPAPAAAPAPVPPLMPADAMVPPDRATMKPILLQAAAENRLPPDLVMAQAWAESNWQDSAVSSAQAVGVLQLTAPTVDFVSRQLLGLDHPLDPLNPTDNARMGTLYLRHLLNQTDNDLRQALIAYNEGPAALRRNGPYPEAERYADRVLALRPLFVTGPPTGPGSSW